MSVIPLPAAASSSARVVTMIAAECCLEGGPQLRGEPAAQLRHAVVVLVAQDQGAAPGAVLVGVVAVRVEALGESPGQPVQFLGPVLGPPVSQVGFGILAG